MSFHHLFHEYTLHLLCSSAQTVNVFLAKRGRKCQSRTTLMHDNDIWIFHHRWDHQSLISLLDQNYNKEYIIFTHLKGKRYAPSLVKDLIQTKNLYMKKINYSLWPSTRHSGISTTCYQLTIVISTFTSTRYMPVNLK